MRHNKEKKILEFKPHFANDIKEVEFEPKLIPWINDFKINQDISIEL